MRNAAVQRRCNRAARMNSLAIERQLTQLVRREKNGERSRSMADGHCDPSPCHISNAEESRVCTVRLLGPPPHLRPGSPLNRVTGSQSSSKQSRTSTWKQGEYAFFTAVLQCSSSLYGDTVSSPGLRSKKQRRTAERTHADLSRKNGERAMNRKH